MPLVWKVMGRRLVVAQACCATPVPSAGLLGLSAAHKLARLIYTMLTKGEEYTDQGQDYYEECYRQRVLRNLSQRAEKLGMKLVENEQPA